MKETENRVPRMTSFPPSKSGSRDDPAVIFVLSWLRLTHFASPAQRAPNEYSLYHGFQRPALHEPDPARPRRQLPSTHYILNTPNCEAGGIPAFSDAAIP